MKVLYNASSHLLDNDKSYFMLTVLCTFVVMSSLHLEPNDNNFIIFESESQPGSIISHEIIIRNIMKFNQFEISIACYKFCTVGLHIFHIIIVIVKLPANLENDCDLSKSSSRTYTL